MKEREWLISIIVGDVLINTENTYDKVIMNEYINMKDRLLNMSSYLLGKELNLKVDVVDCILNELGDFGCLLSLETLYLLNRNLINVDTFLYVFSNINVIDNNELIKFILNALNLNIKTNVNTRNLYNCIIRKDCLPIISSAINSIGLNDNIFIFNFYEDKIYCDYIDIFLIKRVTTLDLYRSILFSVIVRKIECLKEEELNTVYTLLDNYSKIEDFNFVEVLEDKPNFLLNNIWNLETVVEDNRLSVVLDTIYQLMLLPLYPMYEKYIGKVHCSITLSINDYIDYLKHNNENVIDNISKTYYELLGVSFDIIESNEKEDFLTELDKDKIASSIREQYKRSLLGL